MNLELWSESERRRWSIGQCRANGRVWLTWECSGVHVRRGENKQPPSALPSIAARRHEEQHPPTTPQVGLRRRHQLPALAAAALRCRTSPATLLTHAHQPEWHRAPHTADGTLRTPARESLTPGTLTLIPGARLPGRA